MGFFNTLLAPPRPRPYHPRMPESLQPELIELRDAVERFARDVLEPTAQSLADGTLALSDAHAQVREASKTAGFFTMTQPAAFGGSEAGQLALTVARDTLAAHNSPVSSAVFGPGPGVLAGVEEPLRSSHLEPLLRGEKRVQATRKRRRAPGGSRIQTEIAPCVNVLHKSCCRC